jgi:hypothetical protein
VDTVDQVNVSATLTVAVPAARVFAMLADPTSLDLELNIVVEATGQWNKDAMTAFQTQLADRYLTAR